MNKYIIQYGVSGGFNDTDNFDIITAENTAYAWRTAWVRACEIYESYIGTGGLKDVEDIMEEENCSEEEALILFDEERESWIDYMYYDYSEEKVKEFEEKYGKKIDFK